MVQNSIGTDGIDSEKSEQDPQSDMCDAGRDQVEKGQTEVISDFQRQDTEHAPQYGILKADVAVHVPFFVGVVPPFTMTDALQNVARDPFGGCCDNHTAEEQEYGAGLQFVQVAGHNDGCDSVDGAQRTV